MRASSTQSVILTESGHKIRPGSSYNPCSMTNMGLHIQLGLLPSVRASCAFSNSQAHSNDRTEWSEIPPNVNGVFAILDCLKTDEDERLVSEVAILLFSLDGQQFARVNPHKIYTMDRLTCKTERTDITVKQRIRWPSDLGVYFKLCSKITEILGSHPGMDGDSLQFDTSGQQPLAVLRFRSLTNGTNFDLYVGLSSYKWAALYHEWPCWCVLKDANPELSPKGAFRDFLERTPPQELESFTCAHIHKGIRV